MRRRSSRGFTLVELMVSLVAGLIIAIAVVGLARAATTAFHEQVRLTTVEQSVRNASNRLRYDLTKVSFMGTGNIKLASGANVPYGHRVAVNGNGQAGDRFGVATQNLQGIRILPGAGKAPTEGTLGLASNNGLAPDDIIITGNLTTDDEYVGTWNDTGGSCSGGQVVLKLTHPSNYALVNMATTDAEATQNARNAFVPAPAHKFLARVVDRGGCQHYVTVSDAVATGVSNPAVGDVKIDLCASDSDGTSVLRAHMADPNDMRLAGPKGTGCGVDPGDEVRISPLHKVHWKIRPNNQVLLAPPSGVGAMTEQFMLYRAIQDPTIDATANPDAADIPELTQLVAEYAIDLKFGIVVDDATQPPPNNVRVFDLDSDNGPPGSGGPVDTWTQPASTTIAGQPGPQRVRAVKFRISTRAALPDRTANLSILPGTPYISRYCLDNQQPSTCKRFARVRMLLSEVALINQGRMTY